MHVVSACCVFGGVNSGVKSCGIRHRECLCTPPIYWDPASALAKVISCACQLPVKGTPQAPQKRFSSGLPCRHCGLTFWRKDDRGGRQRRAAHPKPEGFTPRPACASSSSTRRWARRDSVRSSAGRWATARARQGQSPEGTRRSSDPSTAPRARSAGWSRRPRLCGQRSLRWRSSGTRGRVQPEKRRGRDRRRRCWST